MPNNNRQIVKETITTGTVTNGLLNPEQSRKFIQQTFDATPLQGLIRHEMRVAKTGEIDKIGIASRIPRKKTENADDNYRAKPNFSAVPYACTAVRLPWEISEETLRENIEGQSLEDTITNLMTTQIGVDTEDLYLNGDTEVDEGNADYAFLSVNDGWIKQIKNGGHVFDASTVNSGAMSLDVFYALLATVPNKYNNGKLRWLMSPTRAQKWEQFLLNKVIEAGGAVPQNLYNSPVSIPTVTVPNMPDDCIILTDPKNLIAVNSYSVVIRKTTEGEKAIMMDKRFYVVHFDFDAIIEELDATGIITGLA